MFLCLVIQLCLTLCSPIDCNLPGSSVHGNSPGKNTRVGCHALLQDLPNPGIKPRSPALQPNSLPSEPPEKPQNTGVDSLSIFQGNFLTQESNRGLLHYRQILYQLSYQGSILGLKRRKPVLRLKCVKYKYLLVIVLSCLSAAKVVLACLLSSSA